MIVFEGLDGSGKSTQVNLLIDYFISKSLPYFYLHFPVLESQIYGNLIAKFLRGEFGNVHEVDTQLVALLYAGDRNNFKGILQNYLDQGVFLIIDRYVSSNIAFQCAKVDNTEKKKELKKWIEDLEYSFYSIPKPDYTFYLSVPFTFIENNLKNERTGLDRDYLKGKSDIHEDSLKLQQKVQNEYLTMVNNYDFFEIKCFDASSNIISPDAVNAKILNILKEINIAK